MLRRQAVSDAQYDEINVIGVATTSVNIQAPS